MKPIRREELNHLENTIKSKFRSKANAVDSEIQQQAQELSDKKKPKFPAACKVDKKLDRLKAAEKKYKAYVTSKDSVEKKLLEAVAKEARAVEQHLERLAQTRSGWDRSFNGYETKHIDDPASDYFIDKLERICYDEALEYCRNNHKLSHELENKKEMAENILYSGGDINSIVRELAKTFKSAGIVYYVPQSLLQLPSK